MNRSVEKRQNPGDRRPNRPTLALKILAKRQEKAGRRIRRTGPPVKRVRVLSGRR